MDNKKMVIVTLGGGTALQGRRQALGLSPMISERGGQRRSPNGQLIDAVGGDSYGK